MTKREVFIKLLNDYGDLVEETHGVGEEWHGTTELGYMLSKIEHNYDTASNETDVEED
jgi:hypothetical protein